ncbi:EcsC family protein [Micropruina sp.]|uniref:EcsC family protein n=1 Tax=Micropruina sp. TaxID=2737536 RepID=UPI002623F969|nr:EcsC family protein [Micropruina sp.]
MSTQEPSSSQEASKTLVQRAPEVAGNVLRQILEFAIDGNMTIPGAKDAAARCLQTRGDHEAAVESVVRQHVGLAGAQGFLTNLGGLLLLPVALPTNLAGLAVVQMRMIAAIAHLRGYDLNDRRVRSALTLAMLGEDDVRKLVASGKLPSTPLGVATAPVFDPILEHAVSERVFGDLGMKMAGKHAVVQVAKRIPLVGGGVGAAADGYFTYALGQYARREFVRRRG